MYSELFELQAESLKAIAHPRRLEIVQLLRDQELCVTDIYEMLDLPQANISQHLMIMREAGVVRTKRLGKQVVYQLTHPKLVEMCDSLRDMLVHQYQGTKIAKHLLLHMNELLPVVHDPVCQMRVSPKTAGASVTHQGTEYYFCASGCRKKFKEQPEKYASN
jgi:ArsR family transcriptional regulator, virulence genes transcriptional regulator